MAKKPYTEITRRPSPHGEGRLKFFRIIHEFVDVKSLPARGGWIEIFSNLNDYRCSNVPPRTGRVD